MRLDIVQNVWTSLKCTHRRLAHAPIFTITAVATLALGISAVTTVFAVANAAVFRSPRAVAREGVYAVTLSNSGAGRDRQLTASQRTAVTRSTASVVGPMATAVPGYTVVQSDAQAAELPVEVVSGDYTEVFGLRPGIGHPLDPSRSPAVGSHLIVSDRLWREWFGADPGIVGRARLRVRGTSMVIVGIAPRSFRGSHDAELWVPLESWRKQTDPPGAWDAMPTFVALTHARDAERLASTLTEAVRSAGEAVPAHSRDFIVRLISLKSQSSLTTAYERRLAWLAIGLAVLVWLAACANLMNMMVARSAERAGEVAVRSALGASATQLFLLFFAESLVLAAAGAVAALGLTAAALRMVAASFPALRNDRYTRALPDLTPDWTTFAVAAGAAAAAALLVGGVTAWRGSRATPARGFGGTGVVSTPQRRAQWLRTGLVSVQVSTAVILMIGTGLYLVEAVKSFGTQVTFDVGPLAAARVDARLAEYHETRGRAFFDDWLRRVQGLPGIEHAALTSGLPSASLGSMQTQNLQNLYAEDEADPGRRSGWRLLTGRQAGVSPGFLDVLGLSLLRGRNVAATDRDEAARVVILSESASRSLWPGLDPIGKRVQLAQDPTWWTVVGVFEDASTDRGDTSWMCRSCLALYPYEQRYNTDMILVTRSATPGTAAEQVRLAARALDHDVAIFDAAPATATAYARATPQRALTMLVGALGLVALLIATIGVYGVIAYSVSRRFREFGIRLALGATPRHIVRAVVDDGVRLVLIGLLPGVLLASWATRVLEFQLVRLMPNDIPTWAAVPTLILAVGVLAAYLPARRASRVNPNTALRDL